MDEGKGIVRAARDVHRGPAPKLRWRERLRVEFWARYGRRLAARQERREKAVMVADAYDSRFGGPAAALSKLEYADEDLLGPGPRARRRAEEHERLVAAQRDADARAARIATAPKVPASHGYTTPNDA